MLYADAGLIASAAGEMLDVSCTVGDLIRLCHSEWGLYELGLSELDRTGCGALGTAEAGGRADVRTTLEHLGQLLAGDADRLYQVAFAVRDADGAAVERMGG